MKCVDSSEVMQLYTRQLSAERSELLNAHFNHCAKCAGLRDEIEAMTARMRYDENEFHDGAAVDEVMTLIRTGRADKAEVVPAKVSFWKCWQTWLLVPATAAATALLMLTFWPREGGKDGDGFQARGADSVNLDRWVSLQVFRATTKGYEPVHDVVAADDALAFAYLNRPGNPLRYLVVFAVDGRGEIFWYYPPSSADENPGSITIQSASQPIELPEQVTHDLKPGPLRIFGIFSSEPIAVRTIEDQAQRDLRVAQDVERMSHLGLGGVGQFSVLLQVQASTRKDTHR